MSGTMSQWPVVVVALLLLGGAAIFLLWQRSKQLAALARRMASEVHTIAATHAGHRLQTETLPQGFDELAQAVNALAARYERLLTAQTQAVTQARADLAAEHARLIALIQNLGESVLVCNADGDILLYNRQAQALLGDAVGLGRPIYRALDRDALEHALMMLRHREETGSRAFVTRTRQGRMVRVRLSPVMEMEGGAQMQGFVITLEDITEQVAVGNRRDALVQTLSHEMRSGLANIRAAIETVQQFSDMDPSTRRELERVISEESARLSESLDATLEQYADVLRARWRLEEIHLPDLMAVLRHVLGLEEEEETLHGAASWVRVDSPALAQALRHLTRPLPPSPALSVQTDEAHVQLILTWPTERVSAEALKERVAASGESEPSLEEIIAYHGGEAWVEVNESGTQTRLVILLGRLRAPERKDAPPAAPTAPRPEYYDFDLLFRGPAPAASLDATPLRQLRYLVFDTETTGLDPDSDEIIAMGAVRIVNMRLLEGERFDRRIRPRRPVPPSATRIHGLRNADLKDAPRLEEVLPAFHAFAEDAVLVAHNAAFDMRFLQSAEKRTQVRFTQPVLDTLLLSAIVHPEHKDHSIEAIARRLGVEVTARHSALGDAITTARIFLKLIPLLESRGIVTLAQAREASEQTYFARIRY